MSAIETDLDRHSKDTGIPKAELKRMCLRAGLDQLQRGELKVKADEGLLPVFLPADDVRLLRELCEAADIEGGADGLIAGILESIARDSLTSTASIAAGVQDLILDGWVFEDPKATKAAMQAVVDRWNAKQPEAG